MLWTGRMAVGHVLPVVLPLGISFYTFQSLSYTIDVYRGDAKAMRNFIDFSCFVSMFPHLVAGPILKFSYLADQLEHRTLTLDKFARGAAFFCLGMAKKVLLPTLRQDRHTAFNAAPCARRMRGSARLAIRSRSISISALLGHGHRHGPDARVRLCQELRHAVPV